MAIPKLKRINVSSENELDIWLANNSSQEVSTMVVTHASTSHRKFVSRERIGQLLETHGWEAGPRYTLGSGILGHVITKC